MQGEHIHKITNKKEIEKNRKEKFKEELKEIRKRRKLRSITYNDRTGQVVSSSYRL